MLALPLIGWAMLSAADYPIPLAGSVMLPAILPQNAFISAWLHQLHTVLAYALFGVILAHVGAGLMHALIRRDGVLASMALRWTGLIADRRNSEGDAKSGVR